MKIQVWGRPMPEIDIGLGKQKRVNARTTRKTSIYRIGSKKAEKEGKTIDQNHREHSVRCGAL